MRLLQIDEDGSLSLVTHIGKEVPPYAILSHTWGSTEEEVSFADFTHGGCLSKIGYDKIRSCARQTQKDGLKHFWVDTCCINKDSSAELSEAINSIFGQSRWFKRGWTLQELLAPADVLFFDASWSAIGFKSSLKLRISEITGIDSRALHDGTALDRFSVAERMSWASTRQTTRVKDEAYCLLGISDVNMPLIYGEGRKAFLRLQEELLAKFDDASIFAYVSSKPSAPTTEITTHPDIGIDIVVSEADYFDQEMDEELIVDTIGLYSSSPTYYREAAKYIPYPVLGTIFASKRESNQPSLHMTKIANLVQLQVALWRMPLELLREMLRKPDHVSDAIAQAKISSVYGIKLTVVSIRKLRTCVKAVQTGSWAVAFMNCRRRHGGIVGILLREGAVQGVYIRQHFPSFVETENVNPLQHRGVVQVCTIFVEANSLTTRQLDHMRSGPLEFSRLLGDSRMETVVRATNLRRFGLLDVDGPYTETTTNSTLLDEKFWRSPDTTIPVINVTIHPKPGHASAHEEEGAICKTYPNITTADSLRWQYRETPSLDAQFVPTNRGSRIIMKMNEHLRLIVRTQMQWERRESRHHVDRLIRRWLLSLTIVADAEHEATRSESTILLEDSQQQEKLDYDNYAHLKSVISDDKRGNGDPRNSGSS